MSEIPPHTQRWGRYDAAEDDKKARRGSSGKLTKQKRHRPGTRRAAPIDTRTNDSCDRHSNSTEAGEERRDAPPLVVNLAVDEEREKESNSNNNDDDDALSVSTSISDGRSLPSLAKVASALSDSIRSQHSKIPADNLVYWSSLSVCAAIAVIEAKGSDALAQKAANVVLEAGKKKRRPASKSSLRSLATRVSVKVLEAGGEHNVAAAVVVAIMNSQTEDGDSKHATTNTNNNSTTTSSTATDSSGKSQSKINKITSSPTTSPSANATRRRNNMKEKEDRIARRKMALEEAESANRRKERELDERMAALEATTIAMMSEKRRANDDDDDDVNAPREMANREGVPSRGGEEEEEGLGTTTTTLESTKGRVGNPRRPDDDGFVFERLKERLSSMLSDAAREGRSERLEDRLSSLLNDAARGGRPAAAPTSPLRRSNFL